MEASIYYQDKHRVVIQWSDPSLGFGELSMVWDAETNRFILDAEMVSAETVIRIFKALP